MVEALVALRGVQDIVAITTVAEIGDLTRFDSPRQLTAFVGLNPSEHSSGQPRRQGSITKAGNSHVRRVLVEGAWAYRYPADSSYRLEGAGAVVCEVPSADRAWKTLQRCSDGDRT